MDHPAFQDTLPAEFDAASGPDPWAEFRVTHATERLRLLRELRDGSVPINLNAPDGATLSATLWAVDDAQQRLNLSADDAPLQLERMAEADEVVAVAYLANVKVQFELHSLVLVRSARATALQCGLPGEVYRFQRRDYFRVRTSNRNDAVARFRHPALPEMALALRLLDISIGGCALWLPHDVPPLPAGTRLGAVQIELDAETRYTAPATVQHVTSIGGDTGRGVRLGCEWSPLPGAAERQLQRWIDRVQQRRRLLSLD